MTLLGSCCFPLLTKNWSNGSQGFSPGATFAKAKAKKKQRQMAAWYTLAMGPFVVPASGPFALPVTVTVTRLAPSNGLDPHDGLGSALKGVIDGIADGLGLKNDRDPRVTWVLKQERAKTYQVRIEVRRREQLCDS